MSFLRTITTRTIRLLTTIICFAIVGSLVASVVAIASFYPSNLDLGFDVPIAMVMGFINGSVLGAILAYPLRKYSLLYSSAFGGGAAILAGVIGGGLCGPFEGFVLALLGGIVGIVFVTSSNRYKLSSGGCENGATG